MPRLTMASVSTLALLQSTTGFVACLRSSVSAARCLSRTRYRQITSYSGGSSRRQQRQDLARMVGSDSSDSNGLPSSPLLGRGREVFSLAPMMEYTDRHMRFLLRLLTTRTVLWTEMIPSLSITHNSDELERYLGYNEEVEHPVVLQIGGSDTTNVEEACRLVKPFNYDAINLNCGCPSDKVAGSGAFGAALMRSPSLVKDLCLSMRDGAGGDTPITVKCRIGVDNDDSYEQLAAFVDEIHRGAGVNHFIVHARKAILGGLSPAENRTIPPLKHDYVYRLVKDFPDVDFTLNGGINTYEEALSSLEQGAHGVMVGRAWTTKPWYWSQADSRLFGTKDPGLTRREVLEVYSEYGERQEKMSGHRWLMCRRKLVRPVWHLFYGEKNGKRFRVVLESLIRQERPFGEIVRKSLQVLHQDQIDQLPGQKFDPTQTSEDGKPEVVTARGIPDGRFRDGRMLYTSV